MGLRGYKTCFWVDHRSGSHLKQCFVCRQRCLDTYTEHQHCALAHSSHNPRRNQQGYWNFYGIDHLTACGYVARLGSCVSCERDVNLGLTRSPPTCGHSVRGERTVAGSCPANRTPLGSHVCAPGGVMISVSSSVPWLGHFEYIVTSLILDRSKLRWIETPCRSCTQARFFERTRRLVARVSGTEG